MKKYIKAISIIIAVFTFLALGFFVKNLFFNSKSNFYKIENKKIDTKEEYLNYLIKKYGDSSTNIKYVTGDKNVFYFEKRKKSNNYIIESYQIDKNKQEVVIFKPTLISGK